LLGVLLKARRWIQAQAAASEALRHIKRIFDGEV